MFGDAFCTFRWYYHFPLDDLIGFGFSYPMDSDYHSDDGDIQPLKNRWLDRS